jgi:hypothetical protein
MCHAKKKKICVSPDGVSSCLHDHVANETKVLHSMSQVSNTHITDEGRHVLHREQDVIIGYDDGEEERSHDGSHRVGTLVAGELVIAVNDEYKGDFMVEISCELEASTTSSHHNDTHV